MAERLARRLQLFTRIKGAIDARNNFRGTGSSRPTINSAIDG
ncbi:MAG: hypothetical protein R3B91_11615 [Planctomycetaceae bacterium]